MLAELQLLDSSGAAITPLQSALSTTYVETANWQGVNR
jgi:hypothetical protein